MRLYEGNIVDRGMSRRFRSRVETRDAIVWDFDDTNKIVRCKVQGSNEYILCHYPRNWQTLPPWCRRGNAVRIMHKSGVRGYFEVIGHGRAVPTPVSGNQLPTAETLFDGVLTGGNVYPYGGLSVKVDSTTYRISGTTYSLLGDSMEVVCVADMDALLEYEGIRTADMDAILEPSSLTIYGIDILSHVDSQKIYEHADGSPVLASISISQPNAISAITIKEQKSVTADMDALLESEFASVTLDAAPSAPEARYDVLAAGTDNTLDVVKGTAATSPSLPSTPASHVKIGHVLVLGDVTAITDGDINSTFETRKINNIAWAVASGSGTIDADGYFEYNSLPGTQTPYVVATVTITDQYGWNYSSRWVLTFELLYGTGGISLSAGGTYGSAALTKTISSGYQTNLYYQRNQAVSEDSPVIQVTVANENVSTVERIQLLTELGGLIE